MIRLANSLKVWGTPNFNDVLKKEMEQQDVDLLPLQQGLSTGSYAVTDAFEVMIISISEETDFIRAKAGIFYAGIIAGCSCADDPTPVDKHSEYCEVLIDINKVTAEATVALLAE